LEEQKSTYLEVVRQSFSVLATQVGSRAGRQVTCLEGSEEQTGTEGLSGSGLVISIERVSLPPIAFFVNQEMLSAVPAPPEATTPAETAMARVAEDSSGKAQSPSRARDTLDLLMDVELPVSVSFGRTQVQVQEILKLVTGSIIELERSISEPVELIVNNCVIARGEVVVVEGNYGVRIREVMSRRERLQESRRHLLPDEVSAR
jgi:flagellar motor switch protein FliN/FliY